MNIGDRVRVAVLRANGTIIGKRDDLWILWFDLPNMYAWCPGAQPAQGIDPHYLRMIDPTEHRGYFAYDTELEPIAPRTQLHQPRPALVCVTCPGGDPNPYAEPNLPDGRFQCFSCRSVRRRVA